MSQPDDKQPPRPPRTLHVRPGVDDAASTEGGTPSARRRVLSVPEYVDGVLSGDRSLLARAVTLIESNAPAHQELAQEVLTAVLPRRRDALRVGITGVPGAGKSTLIENLGGALTARGHRVAVTAVDPSSSLTGGSILGDKTRMEKLAADPNAFIRPSPSGGALGGVARKTRETILLFEAAGYDVILVETVGVGQSEAQVRGLVDFFMLVLLAGAGDDLQGIKKGVIELADAIVINKADGANLAAAHRARSEFEQALHYLRPATTGWQTRAVTCSAQTGDGLLDLWTLVQDFAAQARRGGAFAQRRAEQERLWLRALVREGLDDLLRSHPGMNERLAELEDKVARGEMPTTSAARQILDRFRR